MGSHQRAKSYARSGQLRVNGQAEVGGVSALARGRRRLFRRLVGVVSGVRVWAMGGGGGGGVMVGSDGHLRSIWKWKLLSKVKVGWEDFGGVFGVGTRLLFFFREAKRESTSWV